MQTRSRALTAVGLAALVAAIWSPAVAQAQDRGNPERYGKIVPYVWFSNLDGRAVIDDTTIHMGSDQLKTNLAVQAEYGKGRWRGVLLINRGTLQNIAEKGVDPTSTSGHCCGPDQVALVDGPYNLTVTQVEALGSVQLGPFTDTWGIEAQVGLRYHHHDLDLALTDPVLAGNFGTSWVEPVVGLRYHSSIGSKVWFTILSNGAGFGLGSEFTWVLDGEVGYRLGDNLDLSMRYRYLETNYRNSSTGIDQYDWRKGQVQGWLFGVAYKW
jgi:hypothetical protein